MRHTVITPPVAEPVSLAEAKAMMRVDYNTDDALISTLITSAREWCEDYCQSTFCTTAYELALTSVECTRSIALPKPPIAGVVSVKVQRDGDLVALDTSEYGWGEGSYGKFYLNPVVASTGFGRIPTEQLVIRYTAGYGDPTEVPEGIRVAILLATKHLYYSATVIDKTFDPLPWGVENALGRYRLWGYA